MTSVADCTAMRVVVVDDDNGVRAFVKRVLERAGHSVEECHDGATLVSRVEAVAPDVIVTDLFMPDVDGYQVLRQLAATRPELPVVVISGGHASMGDQHMKVAQLLNATRVLPKPFSAAALLNAVTEAAPTSVLCSHRDQ